MSKCVNSNNLISVETSESGNTIQLLIIKQDKTHIINQFDYYCNEDDTF